MTATWNAGVDAKAGGRASRNGRHRPTATTAEAEHFAQHHESNERPNALAAVVLEFHRSRDERGLNRHQAEVNGLFWAARDCTNKYPWLTAKETLRAASIDQCDIRGETFDADDFEKTANDAIAAAIELGESECHDRAHRNPDGVNLERFAVRTEDVGYETTFSLAGVVPTATRWLWKGWLPLGKVSIFEGESDVGKSTITLNWSAIVSTGRRWPESVINGKSLVSQSDPADVVLVGVEDDPDDTVVPRLIAAGADLRKVHALKRPIDEHGKPKPFTVPDDIDWLRRAVVGVNAKLVIIDPITACLPENAKHGVDSSIRRILMHLVDLARETDCAIVMIRHFNKASGMSAKDRGGGSVAYSALVRSVIQATPLVNPTDDGGHYAIGRAIGNLSPRPLTITYALESAPTMSKLPTPEDDGLGVAVVKYCGTSDLTPDQLVGADGAKTGDGRKAAPMRDDAEAALRDVLDSGPMKMTEAVAEVERITGCSQSTAKAAAKRVGVVKGKVYGGNGKVDHWTWELPPLVTKPKANKVD